MELAGLDKEEIADGAFRQMRFPIEQDTVESACRNRFPFGQDVVQKVRRLDVGWQGAGQVSSRLGDDELHTDAIVFWCGRAKRFGHDRHGGGSTQSRIETDVAGSSGDRNSQVSVLLSIADVVAHHRFVEETRPIVFGNRDYQANPVCRTSEPSKMLVSHKNPAAVRADCFIDTVAIEKAMIEDRHNGRLFFHKPIVEINPHRQFLLQRAEECLGLLERFLIFPGRIGVSDNPRADLQVSLSCVPYQRSNHDIEIEITVPADVSK